MQHRQYILRTTFNPPALFATMSTRNSNSAALPATSTSSSFDQVKSFLTVILPCFMITQGLAYASSHPSVRDFKMQKLAIFTIMVQWLVFFIHASGLLFGNARTERYYDLTGSLTFFFTALWSSASLEWHNRSTRQNVLSSFVQIWALRLGAHLFSRINQHGGIDSRFVEIKKSLLRFLVAWTLQGVWVFVTSLPVLSLNQAIDPRPLSVVDYIGFALWGIGFTLEVVADEQKSVFKTEAANKNKFINVGLWSISRHPNYFGEILLWFGLCLSATHGMALRLSAQFISAWASPMFVSLLLIFVSGIPMLEKAADAKWGTDKAYLEYKARTPVLIPFIGRRGAAPF